MPAGVLRHVIDAISPASRAHAAAARAAVAGVGAPILERLAAALAGAQHTPRPRGDRRTIVVVAGDHGAGDPGISLGDAHPTAVAARAIADGSAALAQVARTTRTPIAIVDAGCAEPAGLPAAAIALGRGPSRHLLREPAMTVIDAALALEAGIALVISLADDGLDLLCVGALGLGSELSAAALLAAATGAPPTGLADPDAERAGVHGATLAGRGPLEQLAALGGPDTAVLAGALLAAASIHVPVLLDGHATGAAALAAAAFAPAVTGSLIAAHAGGWIQPRILAQLGLVPVFEVGLGHGEGTGAAMALALVDQVTALIGRSR